MSESLLSQSIKLLNLIAGYIRESTPTQEAKALEALLERLQKQEFHIAVVGGYNRGKSTLLNALLGEEVLPVGNQPTTKCIFLLHQDDTYKAHLNDNKEAVRQFENATALRDYLVGISLDKTSISDLQISVYLPHKLGEGVVLIDTPGIVEAHEGIAISYLDWVDGILYVFGACEQPKEEFQLFRKLGNDFDLFCAINRIDEPNTPADLEENVEHLMGIIGPLTPYVQLVSGYRGLLSKQLEREPDKYGPIIAADRRLEHFADHEELLEASHLLMFEDELYKWLRKRPTWQLLCGLRLAKQGLDTVHEQAVQAEKVSQERHKCEAPALKSKGDDAKRRQRQLESALKGVHTQVRDEASVAWDSAVMPAIQHELLDARSSVSSLVSNTSPTDLKYTFTKAANNAWSSAVSSIRSTMLNQARRIGKRVSTQIERDCDASIKLPNFRLRLSSSTRSPWPAPKWGSSTYLPKSTADILGEVKVSHTDGFLGDIRRSIANTWTDITKEVSGFKDDLLTAYRREAQSAEEDLREEVEKAWEKWQKSVVKKCDQVYSPNITKLKKQVTEAEAALKVLEDEVAMRLEETQEVRKQRDEYVKMIEELEAELRTNPLLRSDPVIPKRPPRLSKAPPVDAPSPGLKPSEVQRPQVQPWVVALIVAAIVIAGILAVVLIGRP